MFKDCDGDGIPDHVCSDTNLGHFGVIQSSNGCANTWPNGVCSVSVSCGARPSAFCTHPGANYMFKDCDGDGISDHVCSDSTLGHFGVIQSSKSCANTWPNGVCSTALPPPQ